MLGRHIRLRVGLPVTSALIALAAIHSPAAHAPKVVSYHKDVWPIFQAKCQMCHQPASPGGKLVLTTFGAFKAGGEHGAVFVAGKPDRSAILEYLTGKRTLMPKGGSPLPDADIQKIKTWIAQGAIDDTPTEKDPIDAAHPPVYTAAPVITALAYSPDGKTLAVSGYREVILHHSDGSGIIARLVGQAHKILSIAYSPDGKLLAAAGGTPARNGEIQFWDTATNKLVSQTQSGFDTVFGASFSPNGKELAFGCADNSARVISVPDGKQLLKFDNHSDWVFATAFTTDSKDILTTGRDQAVKLTIVGNGSFIDDINTHTSAERALVRNPKKDQVIVGGDDGIPRMYKVYRTEVRTMNQEDHNLLATFERQPGTITALAMNADGSLVAVGSEGDAVNVYAVPIVKMVPVGSKRASESVHVVPVGKLVATLKGHKGAIYAVAFRPDGKQLATGGFDGTIRLYDIPSGTLVKSFSPVPISKPVVRRNIASFRR